MKKEMNLTYKSITNISIDEIQRHLDAAFDVLFEEIFTLSSDCTNLRQPEDSKVTTQHRLSQFNLSEIGC